MNNEQKIELETLTPIVLDQDQKEKLNYKNYETILDMVMKSGDLCNIALTGPYGAGKSTIMNTYENEHQNLRTIHISLPQINDDDIDNIQAKLINQIIHQIEPKLIPQTRFKLKKVVSRWSVLRITILLLLFIGSLVYLFIVPGTQMLPNSDVTLFDIFWTHKVNIFMLMVALISAFLVLYVMVDAQLKKPLIKAIHVDKSQIDLAGSEEGKDSANEKFDKYMDEIIYLFERSKTDALIIEDLDRFKDVKIFYELRQINYLLNKKIVRENHAERSKVKFIYMVRDELFEKSEERTKFFDIIVPVVPVMDNSNAYEILKKMMGDEWIQRLDEGYLKTICLYIRDYRILKNIFNEFQVYYTQLKIEEYQYEAMKLFAMITYKNLWPTDFAELQQGKGTVYSALEEMDKLRDEIIKRIDAEIHDLLEEKKKVEKELLEDIDELDTIYFEGSLYSPTDTAGYYVVDGKNEHEFKSHKELICAMKRGNSVSWRRHGYSSNYTISKDTVTRYFEELNQNEEYAIRKQRLLKRCEKGKNDIEAEIEKKKEERQNIKVEQFKKLTADGFPENISDMFPEDKRVVQIFLQEELIEQDYSSYMTYFYPYSITNDELRYLNKVFARVSDDEQQRIEIEHPVHVLSHLKISDWDSIALPNQSLYMYLIKQGGEDLKRGIKNLKYHSNIEFATVLLQELDNAEDVSVWVNGLFEEWDEFADELIKGEIRTSNQTMFILLKILTYLEDDKLPADTMREFFCTVEKELRTSCIPADLGGFKKIGYKFNDISLIPEDIWTDVYEESVYQISKGNIEYVLKHRYNIQNDECLKKENLSTIMGNMEEPLAKYIIESLEIYVRDVYIPFYVEQSQERDVIIQLLNNGALDLQIRSLLIRKMSIVIDDIRKIGEVSLRDEIVEQGKMLFTNTNVISIWENEDKISDVLYNFLKEHYLSEKCDLSFAFADEYFNETSETTSRAAKLVWELLALKDFGESYANVVEDVSVRYINLPSIKWDEEQLRHIVKTDIIGMTEKNLVLMRTLESSELFYQWLSSNISSYLKLMEKEDLRDDEELKQLIVRDEVVDNDKVKCIHICTQSIHIYEKYNTKVVEEIFEQDLFDGDFKPVIKRYSANRYGKQFVNKLGKYMISYIINLIKMKYALPRDLLIYIMKSNNVTNLNKKMLLATQASYQDFAIAKECLTYCDSEEYLRAFEGQKPKVKATEENRVLIEAMIKRQWLSSFKALDEEYMIFPKKAAIKEREIVLK